MSIDLKPCPFCGGEAQAEYMPRPREHLYNASWQVRCFTCGTRGRRRSSKIEAEESWNARHEAAKAADQPVERCERCNWPIVPEGEAGCWKSNCSMRPMPPLPQPVGMSANEVFENWAREHRKCLNLKRFHGGYEYSDTEFCWLAFQAAWQHKRESGGEFLAVANAIKKAADNLETRITDIEASDYAEAAIKAIQGDRK